MKKETPSGSKTDIHEFASCAAKKLEKRTPRSDFTRQIVHIVGEILFDSRKLQPEAGTRKSRYGVW